MSFNKTTESNSKYNHLEKMTVKELLVNINNEDKTVPLAIEKVIPVIESLVIDIVARMKRGGRIFYMGAGTSGRVGIVDASECPPTFGVPHGLVVGIIAYSVYHLLNGMIDNYTLQVQKTNLEFVNLIQRPSNGNQTK